MEIRFSPELMKRVISAQFRNIPVKKLYQTVYYYVIDSKYRTKKKLDKFLSDQLISTSKELYKKALELRDKDPDITVMNILKFVRGTITYMSDKTNFDKSEYWATAIETFNRKIDDCDGMNGLVYILCRLAGIPSFVIYCAIGSTSLGGHFWCLYYSTRCRKLVSLDATYNYNPTKIRYRREFVLKNDEYQSIWYLFTDKYTFKVLL